MIQATDLRIGNWVEAVNKTGNYYMRILPLHIEMISNKPECGNPIPLTPEILEKCGFVKNRADELCIELDDAASHLEIIIDPLYGFYPQITQTPQGSEERTIFLPYINHLNQLQNLYYALTQTELPITL